MQQNKRRTNLSVDWFSLSCHSVVKRYKTTISGKLVFEDTKTLADESCREEVLILEVFSLVKMTHDEILPLQQNVKPTFV